MTTPLPSIPARRARWLGPTTLFWIVAILVLGAGLGLRDPWPADEPRFALVAKQMVESGDWLFPHRGSELYSDKPPMLMWLQAAFYTVIRDWKVAFLLPSLLAALGTLWCVTDLGARLWTRKVGLYAGWALLFAVQFTYQAKKAQIDPLVTFYITLANYGLLRHILLNDGWRWWWLGWFAAGLGTITKGVGALALLMLLPAAVAAFAGWPRVRQQFRDPRWWLGPVVFALAAGLWLVPMVTAALGQPDPTYRAYLDDILFNQTANRYAKSWDHHQPPWYHLGVVLTMWLPPMLALPWALPAWWRRLKRRDARYLLPLAWWLLILVFFSIPQGKRDVYIMPALPMACLALAPLLPGLLRKAWPPRLAFVFGSLLALAALGAGIAMWTGEPGFERRLVEDRGFTDAAVTQATWLMLAIGVWFSAALLWFGPRRGAHGTVAGLAGLWVLYGVLAYPLMNPSSSAREVMEKTGRMIGPGTELGLVGWKEQNLLQADRAAMDWGFTQPPHVQLAGAIDWMQADPTRKVLILQAVMGPCIDASKAVEVGTANRRSWWLVDAGAVVPGCTPPELDPSAWRGGEDELED
ncbi:glycosyltransferase family 39 protein [Lysobacter sp. SG-8]|uniref:Glycosyltransferase family 39 protein n=1 Tax=Marilutibacter penaei TaxID=2759900 RepID=A0A7W3U1I8_9GAMM|nr:glycosyltransferase family 39 protein [Lysobacter penaei]MBB1087189.1 glycosyltransferase family 39 protein [Lysobacter penaei]